MRTVQTVGFLVVLAATGCGSENKLGDNVNPNSLAGPGGTEETTPAVDTAAPGDTGATGDDDDDTTGDTTGDQTPPDWTGTVPTDPTPDVICELAAALVIELDQYQTPNDGRVVYCHAGGGPNLHMIETDISSCLPHLNHPGDVFPTTGCDS